VRGRRHDLGYEQQEHGECEQHGDAQRHLLAAVRRQVEHQDGERRDEHAGDDQVDGVEQRLPLDHKVVGDVQVGGVVGVLVFARRQRHDVPLAARREVVEAGEVAGEHQVQLRVVVGPRAELERAVLLVEGEVLHLDGAGRLVDGRREPEDVARVGDHGVAVEGDLVHAVGAGERSWEDGFKVIT